MSSGDRWRLPDGRDAIEIERSGYLMRVLPLPPDGWPWFMAAEVAAIRYCTKQPARYLNGAVPVEDEQ